MDDKLKKEIKDYLKDNLRVSIVYDDRTYNADFIIVRLYIEKEMISQSHISL